MHWSSSGTCVYIACAGATNLGGILGCARDMQRLPALSGLNTGVLERSSPCARPHRWAVKPSKLSCHKVSYEIPLGGLALDVSVCLAALLVSSQEDAAPHPTVSPASPRDKAMVKQWGVTLAQEVGIGSCGYRILQSPEGAHQRVAQSCTAPDAGCLQVLHLQPA